MNASVTADSGREGREFHPVADIFPLMPEGELETLADDIREHGQREPIWLHDGKILDGRNRYLACCRIGVAPIFREWTGDGSPVAFVVSLNLHRRHLNEAQRGMVASKIAALRNGQTAAMMKLGAASSIELAAITQPEAAEMLNISAATIKRARAVQERGVPELVAEVTSGRLAMAPAVEIARKPPDEQRAALAEREQEKRERQARREGKLTETQRQRELAKAAQGRLHSICGWFDGFVMGFPKLRVDAALAVSSEEEREQFIESTATMISTLRKLLVRLKEERT